MEEYADNKKTKSIIRTNKQTKKINRDTAVNGEEQEERVKGRE